MKVCTDSCILGAWFANKMPGHSTILDIGSGTGLLMMMLAQKSKACIHGIELDSPAFKQLQENISQNEWKERLTVFPGDVRTYSLPGKYDFIITNPPFFENDLEPVSDEKRIAMHSTELSLQELIMVIDRNVSSDGGFGILLPYHRLEYFQALAGKNYFYVQEKVLIRHSPGHHFSRVILHCSRQNEKYNHSFEMSIHNDQDHAHTEEFIDLLKDYYLYL